MKKPRFEIKTAADGKFHWRLKAANGEIILNGCGYKAKHEAINAIASVMRYGRT